MNIKDFKGSVVMPENKDFNFVQSKLTIINRIVEWQMVFYRDWNDKKLRESQVLFKLFELSKKVMSARSNEDLENIKKDLLVITEKYPG